MNWNPGRLIASKEVWSVPPVLESVRVSAPRSENGSSQRRNKGRTPSLLCMYTPRIFPAPLSKLKYAESFSYSGPRISFRDEDELVDLSVAFDAVTLSSSSLGARTLVELEPLRLV